MSKVVIQTFKEICRRQLDEHVREAVDCYEQAIKMGMSEERALDYLAFRLEVYTRGYAIQKDDSTSWRSFLKDQSEPYHVPGEYLFSKSDERHNLRKITRRYGRLKTGVTTLRKERLAMEGRLLVLHEIFDLSTRQAQKLLHVVINDLFAIENQRTYDYTDYTSERVLGLADGFRKGLDPYRNATLYAELSKVIDLENPESFDRLFKNVFLCMASILEDFAYYEKNGGKNAYFNMANRLMKVDDLIKLGERPFISRESLE